MGKKIVIDGQSLSLSEREREVLHGLIRGLTDKGIAREIGISKYTVRHHLEHVFIKLGTTNRVETVTAAIRLKLDAED